MCEARQTLTPDETSRRAVALFLPHVEVHGCRACSAPVVVARIEGLGRWGLFNAEPTEGGGYAFVAFADGRIPTLRLNAHGTWRPHFPSCPGIDRAHRAFAADVLMGGVPPVLPPDEVAPAEDVCRLRA